VIGPDRLYGNPQAERPCSIPHAQAAACAPRSNTYRVLGHSEPGYARCVFGNGKRAYHRAGRHRFQRENLSVRETCEHEKDDSTSSGFACVIRFAVRVAMALRRIFQLGLANALSGVGSGELTQGLFPRAGRDDIEHEPRPCGETRRLGNFAVSFKCQGAAVILVASLKPLWRPPALGCVAGSGPAGDCPVLRYGADAAAPFRALAFKAVSFK